MKNRFSITLVTALILALFAAPSFAMKTSCGEHYVGSEAPDIINAKVQAKTQELCYEDFGVIHSGLTRTPLWSAEHLTRARLDAAKGMIRKDTFHAEERLPESARAELSDYARSGFDRGHMSPNADMSSDQAQHESFSLANIVPQDGTNNRGIWSGIESAVRTLAKREGNLYVITGPLFVGNDVKALKRRVLVPTHIYKIVYSPKRNAAGVYLVNNAAEADLRYISVAELEQMAGIDFFPSMSPAVKREIMPLPQPKERRGGGKRHGRTNR